MVILPPPHQFQASHELFPEGVSKCMLGWSGLLWCSLTHSRGFSEAAGYTLKSPPSIHTICLPTAPWPYTKPLPLLCPDTHSYTHSFNGLMVIIQSSERRGEGEEDKKKVSEGR